jgi:hypothetical protein
MWRRQRTDKLVDTADVQGLNLRMIQPDSMESGSMRVLQNFQNNIASNNHYQIHATYILDRTLRQRIVVPSAPSGLCAAIAAHALLETLTLSNSLSNALRDIAI